MTPTFDPEGGLALVLLRGSADAGLLSAFGALLALAWLLPPLLPLLGPSAPPALRTVRSVAGASLLLAGLLSLGWLLAESRDMAGAVSEVGVVLQQSVFGHLVAARLALLALAGLLLLRRWHAMATLVAACAVASQAGHDHAWAMAGGPSLLLLSNVVHVLAGGAWLGGLVPLLLVVAAASPAMAAVASRRFAALGTLCVVLLAATALLQASTMVASWAGLFHTAYGWVICAKLALLLSLVGLAARNRFLLTPALARGGAKPALLRSIAIETAAGLLIVLAAALLTSLQPAMDMPPG
jgi:putative copper resistance protein D